MVNVLPPKDKNLLLRLYQYRLISSAIFLAGIIVLIYGILEVPSYIYLSHRLSGIVETDARDDFASNKVTPDQERRVLQIADVIKQDKPRFVGDIEDIRNRINGMNRLDSLTWEKGVWKAVGWSPTREELLALSQSIKELDWVADTNLPVEELARSTDIVFTLVITPQ